MGRWQFGQHLSALAGAAAIVLVAAAGAPRAAAAQVSWNTDFDRASASARRVNKPMLIEFWATWCGACKVMDAEVYSHASVAAAMRKVLPVKVDVDQQAHLARKYEIAATPTLVFTDSYGNELFRYTGALALDPMVQLLKELPGDMTRINELASALARNKDDVRVLAALGHQLRADGLFRASNQYFVRATRARAAREPAAARAAILVAMGRNHLDLKEYDEAARWFERHLREYAGQPSEADAMLGLGRAWLARQKTSEARQILQTLTERHAGTAAAAEATRMLARL